jgi:hypothetical protein
VVPVPKEAPAATIAEPAEAPKQVPANKRIDELTVQIRDNAKLIDAKKLASKKFGVNPAERARLLAEIDSLTDLNAAIDSERAALRASSTKPATSASPDAPAVKALQEPEASPSPVPAESAVATAPRPAETSAPTNVGSEAPKTVVADPIAPAIEVPSAQGISGLQDEPSRISTRNAEPVADTAQRIKMLEDELSRILTRQSEIPLERAKLDRSRDREEILSLLEEGRTLNGQIVAKKLELRELRGEAPTKPFEGPIPDLDATPPTTP